MPKSPKENEEKMMKVLNAWKTLAPDARFGGMTVTEFEAQVNNSLAPRQRLIELDDEITQAQATRDTQDVVTFNKIELVVAGVVADPDYGSDSALYETMGYVRKSERKSGLTRKKKDNGDESP